ncbi:MAG TPA: DUF370 domain-containing protein [Clostridia bacterium]|nr:DUF370 domain-containing protein [Clostridia bacterium]
MYLHIGNEVSIPLRKIIAIIDLETVDPTGQLQEMIEQAKRQEKVSLTSGRSEPKSCIITDDRLYLSSISATTLARRAGLKDRIP